MYYKYCEFDNNSVVTTRKMSITRIFSINLKSGGYLTALGGQSNSRSPIEFKKNKNTVVM